jgi:hypothetical protein
MKKAILLVEDNLDDETVLLRTAQKHYDLAREVVNRFLIIRPPGSFLDQQQFRDHCRIAESIERGDSRDDILNMAETSRWPGMSIWLRENL